MDLYFASSNPHKVEEVRKVIPPSYQLKSLRDLDLLEDIPETADTLEGNAQLKAVYLAEKYDIAVFADDTGLEIEALGGEPGVLSARYAGPQKNSTDNIQKVLDALQGENNRKARFRTVIVLIIDGHEHQFEGIVNGTIRNTPKGEGGFGYDPIFQPDGYSDTFAEMDMETKNKISHRGKAVQQLIHFLANYKA